MTTSLRDETATKAAHGEFRNEPFTDFSVPANEKAMKEAISKVRAEFGKQYPLIIGKERIETAQHIVSTNPSNPSEVIGKFPKATKEHAEKALKVASETFETWKKVPAQERSQYLFKAAELMRQRKFELSAWLSLEIGKSWAEADGDVAEAIDFCEYYAREMLRLSNPAPLTSIPNEKNQLKYIPLGVGLVIPPWNFPLAILVGMSTAAIVSGNTIILKPSSETPGIAFQFAKILEEVGLPPGVFNYMPGPGAEVGDFLVSHKDIRFIAFTGSKEVGLRINEMAAKHQKGQLWIKRVVAEMGGKDAIVVDKDADLEAAAEGIVASAFGFQSKSAAPARASSCTKTSMTRCSTKSLNAPRSSSWAHRKSARFSLDQCPPSLRTRASSSTSKSAKKKVAFSPAAMRTRPKRTDSSSSRRSLPTSMPKLRSLKKKSSDQCWPSPRPTAGSKRSNSPTTPNSA